MPPCRGPPRVAAARTKWRQGNEGECRNPERAVAQRHDSDFKKIWMVEQKRLPSISKNKFSFFQALLFVVVDFVLNVVSAALVELAACV